MIGKAQFTSTHLTETIGTEDFFPTVQAAVERLRFPRNWSACCSMSADSETTGSLSPRVVGVAADVPLCVCHADSPRDASFTPSKTGPC